MFIPAACASEPHNRQQSNPALANEFIDDLNKQRGQPTLATGSVILQIECCGCIDRSRLNGNRGGDIAGGERH